MRLSTITFDRINNVNKDDRRAKGHSVCYRRLQPVFREITLALGGVFYIYPVPDEAVWAIARSLDRIFRRAYNAGESNGTSAEPPPHSRGRKHPAIVELLRHVDDPDCIFPGRANAGR